MADPTPASDELIARLNKLSRALIATGDPTIADEAIARIEAVEKERDALKAAGYGKPILREVRERPPLVYDGEE